MSRLDEMYFDGISPKKNPVDFHFFHQKLLDMDFFFKTAAMR